MRQRYIPWGSGAPGNVPVESPLRTNQLVAIRLSPRRMGQTHFSGNKGCYREASGGCACQRNSSFWPRALGVAYVVAK